MDAQGIGSLRTVSPFPYASWPKLSRREAGLSTRLRELAPLWAKSPLENALLDLTGVRPAIQSLPPERCPPGRLSASLADRITAAVLAPIEGSPRHPVAIELDPRLAAWLIHRTLGGNDPPAPAVPAPSRMELGVLAFALGVLLDAVAASSRVEAGRAEWRVLSVVTTRAVLLEALEDDGAFAVPISITIGKRVLGARTWIPTRTLRAVELPARPKRMARWLRTAPMELRLVAGRVTLLPSELVSLRPNDTVLLDEHTVELGASPTGIGGELQLELASPGTRIGRACVEDGTIVLAHLEPFTEPRSEKGQRMPNHDTDPLERTLTDAPIDIAVELVRFTMPLGELSNLQPGEVVVTGRRIGERVTLRLADRPVATGELVDVEGEIGVRILTVPRDSSPPEPNAEVGSD